MRKLLIILSVILLFSLCQSKRETTRILPIHRFPNLGCTFGYKNVNGKKECQSKEEFFQHPRNETNCTKPKNLNCYKFKNVTACICNRLPKLLTLGFHQRCPRGFIWKCKSGNNRDCYCGVMTPRPGNSASRLPMKCDREKELFCPNKSVCICRKIKKTPVFEPIIEPFEPTLPEPLEPIEPLKPLEPMKPFEPFI